MGVVLAEKSYSEAGWGGWDEKVQLYPFLSGKKNVVSCRGKVKKDLSGENADNPGSVDRFGRCSARNRKRRGREAGEGVGPQVKIRDGNEPPM